MQRYSKKQKMILAIIVALIVTTIAVTFGYFASRIGGPSSTHVDVTGYTVERLTFSDDIPLNLLVTKTTLASGAGDLVDTKKASATLIANNQTKSASATYAVYLNINTNNFIYTQNTSTPEIILTITNPGGTNVTSITGLTYNSTLGGFDITNKKGQFTISSGYTISSTDATIGTTQEWTFTLKFRNLSENQGLNAGKEMHASISMRNANADTLYSKMANAGSTYVANYTGSHNDTMAGSGSQTIYYWASTASNYAAILEKNNVLFAGFCWKMVRTTDTGGVKLIYNGEPVDGTCPSARDTHIGIVGGNATTKSLSSGAYVYGEGFTYSDTTFTLTDTTTQTWSAKTYLNLIGKYTCGTDSSSCTTLYYVGPSSSATYGYANSPYVASYTISSTNYAQVGVTPFSVGYISPVGVGYMFNYFNRYTSNTAPTSSAIMGSDVEFKNGVYNLVGTSTTYDTTHHYTCNSTTATSCASVRYYYYNNYYITLSDGKNMIDTVNAMLYDGDVNKYDSTIKKYLENWYKLNLTDYSSYLEDVIWCNDRSMASRTANGWYPSGSKATYIYFTGYSSNTSNLSCTTETDKFSMSNPKARAKYPIGLLTYQENYLLGNNNLRNTGVAYWALTPNYFDYNDAGVRGIGTDGSATNNWARTAIGVRPSISLAPGVIVHDGDGTTSNPYKIER